MPSSTSTNAKWNIDWNHPKLKDRDGLILLYKMANEQGQPDIAKEAMQRAAELDKKTAPYRPGLPWEGGIGLGKPWNIVDTVKPSAPVAPRPNINAQIHAQAMATPPVTANNEASDILAEFRALLAKSQEPTGPSATQQGGDMWSGWSKPQSVGGVGTINMNQPVQNNGAFVSQNLPVFGGVGQSGWMSSTGIGGRTTADIRSNPKYQAIANQLRGKSDAGLVFGGKASTIADKQLREAQLAANTERAKLDVEMLGDERMARLENVKSGTKNRAELLKIAQARQELSVTRENNKNLWKAFSNRQAQEGAKRVTQLIDGIDLENNPGAAKEAARLLNAVYKGKVDVGTAETLATKIANDAIEEQLRREGVSQQRVGVVQAGAASRSNESRKRTLTDKRRELSNTKYEIDSALSKALSETKKKGIVGEDVDNYVVSWSGQNLPVYYLKQQQKAYSDNLASIDEEVNSLSGPQFNSKEELLDAAKNGKIDKESAIAIAKKNGWL